MLARPWKTTTSPTTVPFGTVTVPEITTCSCAPPTGAAGEAAGLPEGRGLVVCARASAAGTTVRTATNPIAPAQAADGSGACGLRHARILPSAPPLSELPGTVAPWP